MRGDMMSECFRSFYRHIGTQRRIVLLLDNFSEHLSALENAPPPSNIKVVFLPPNATSIYQPLDQGIVRNLKHHYRNRWMTWMVNMIDRGVDPTQRMSLYYTLQWITQAWRRDVQDETICKCFVKSTIIRSSTDETNASQTEDLQLSNLYFQVTDRLPGTECMEKEDSLGPPGEDIDVGEPDSSDIILRFPEERVGGDDSESNSEEQDEYIHGPSLDTLSRVEAIECMHIVLQFAQHQDGITERDLRQIESRAFIFSITDRWKAAKKGG